MRTVRTVIAAMVVTVMLGVVGAPAVQADVPTWTELQALNIVDLVGQVPESMLANHIVSYSGKGGLSLYESGVIEGDTMQITVRSAPRYYDWYGGTYVVNTLGQIPNYDHVASTMPAATVRLYIGTQEVTANVRCLEYIEPGPFTPSTSASQWFRYPELERIANGSTQICASGLAVPANMGGSIWIDCPGADPYAEVWVTQVWELPVPNAVDVTYMGYQQHTFQSFLGDYTPGDAGRFDPIVEQLRATYPDRHPRLSLDAPSGTNYVLFNYPPADIDIYAQMGSGNEFRPMGGTVRMAPDEGMLSQNLQHGGAFPLGVVMQDADQSAGPYLSLMPEVDRFTPPEYFIPAGIPYNECFETGNCAQSVLDEIHNATMSITAVYIKAEPHGSAVEAVTLRCADETYNGSMVTYNAFSEARVEMKEGTVVAARGYAVAIPLILRQMPLTANVEHPAGFFETDSGRMVGYIR